MGMWGYWVTDNPKKIIRLYVTTGFKCPKCKKKVKVNSVNRFYKKNVWVEFNATCKNPKCIVDKFYWEITGEKKLGVQCH